MKRFQALPRLGRRRIGVAGRLLPRVAATLAIFAFAFQSFLTQTHVHFTPAVERVLAAVEQSKTAPLNGLLSRGPLKDHHGYPSDDPAKCPICQEMVYAGSYVAPVAAVFVPPHLAISVIAVVEREPVHLATVSHNWQGRAPPSA